MNGWSESTARSIMRNAGSESTPPDPEGFQPASGGIGPPFSRVHDRTGSPSPRRMKYLPYGKHHKWQRAGREEELEKEGSLIMEPGADLRTEPESTGSAEPTREYEGYRCRDGTCNHPTDMHGPRI